MIGNWLRHYNHIPMFRHQFCPFEQIGIVVDVIQQFLSDAHVKDRLSKFATIRFMVKIFEKIVLDQSTDIVNNFQNGDSTILGNNCVQRFCSK